jgi:WD40 repeat protein
MQRNYGWLDIAEYLSILASVVGAMAAVATQKAALMAAPMSMSLMLNLLHRRKLLSLSRQKIGVEVTEQCQDLSKLVTSLPGSDVAEISTDKQQLKQSIRGSVSASADAKANPLGGIAQGSGWNIAALPLEEMEASLERLCQKFEHQQTEISQLMVNLEKISHELPFNLTNNLTNLPSQSDEQIQYLNQQKNFSSNGYVGAEISSIKTELNRVSEKLNQLQLDTETLVPKKKLKQMIAAIKTLHQENVDARTSILQLNETVSRISSEQTPRNNISRENFTDEHIFRSQFEAPMQNCLQQISDLRGAVAELTRAIALLEKPTQQINSEPEPAIGLISELIAGHSPASTVVPSPGIDASLFYDNLTTADSAQLRESENGSADCFDYYYIPQLHREIQNLSEEIAILEAQMENRLAPLEAIDRHSIEEDLALQAQAIAELQEQTNQILAFYETKNYAPTEIYSKIEQLEAGLNQLTRQIFDLQPQVLLTGDSPQRSAVRNRPPNSSWKCLHTWNAHPEAIFSLDFSQDGMFLATGSADHTVKVWQISSELLTENLPIENLPIENLPIENLARLSQTFTGHTHWVRAIAISPQRDFIASGSADRTIKIWPLTWPIEPNQKLVIPGNGGIHASELEPLKTLTGHSLSVRAIAISPDGQFLASGSADQTIQIAPVADILADILSDSAQPSREGNISKSHPEVDPELYEYPWPSLQTVLTGHKAPVDALAFSPDGQILASGGVDCGLKIWLMNAQELLCTLTDHAEPLTALAFSAHPEYFLDRSRYPGYVLASGSVDCGIKIWHISPKSQETRVILTLTGHSEPITCVKFSPDGKFLASASIDQTIKIWLISSETENISLLCTLTGHRQPVLDLAFRDDRTFASCSADGQVKIWHCIL